MRAVRHARVVRAVAAALLRSGPRAGAAATHVTATALYTPLRAHATGVIEPADIDWVSPDEGWSSGGAVGNAAAATASSSTFTAAAAWDAVHTSALPSVFEDVQEIDAFARSRVLALVRRYRGPSALDDDAAGTRDAASFETEALRDGELFHARLRLPLTGAALTVVEEITHSSSGGDTAAAAPPTALWAHGVSNTAKEAELLAAMHAERLADMLGYHLFTLPSRQRRHAEAAAAAGRYASSVDDVGSGPTAAWRRERWPAPLRRLLTDEETEGGEWQLVRTSAAVRHYVTPPHTVLSPCLLDIGARLRIENFFANAPAGCPSFAQMLSTERVRTRTASTVASGGEEAMLAHLALPPALTGLSESSAPLIAAGKAKERLVAVQLACMHAELLLDAVNVPIFADDETQRAHAAAARSFGRPAPLPGALPKDPSHLHLPAPLKAMTEAGVEAGSDAPPRTATRSADDDWVHRHELVTEQSSTFVESVVCESTAVDDLTAFLAAEGAPRATAPFLRMRLNGLVRSTVLLPVADLYGIRGGVGVAAKTEDADVLAAMHALDVLMALGVAVKRPEKVDTAWKALRRELVGDVPELSGPAAAPSPPARRLSAKKFTLSVALTSASVEAAAAAAAAPPAKPQHPRRPPRRARLASEATATLPPRYGFAENPEPASATPAEAPAAAPRSAREAAEETLATVRAAVPREHWDLQPDSPDGYIMIAPSTAGDEPPHRGEEAIVSPRTLDKLSKGRIISYLSTVGRRLGDVVVVRQLLTEEETEGRPRHRCALKVPLPSVCGEPRLALGEGETAADAESAACMHAELILDALGVCLYTDVARQKRHADACARWGRWAPSGPQEEQPSSTVAPPPLRREYAGSLHWERRKARRTEPQREGGRGSGAEAAAGEKREKPTAESQETRQAKQRAVAGVAPGQAALPEPSSPSDTGAWTTEPTREHDPSAFVDLSEADVDVVSKNRVQYYLRHEGLAAGKKTFTTEAARTSIMHVTTWALPLPARFVSAGDVGSDAPASNLECLVTGVAPTRKDAEALSWMHAERCLDALGIPLFPNLPQLQAYHARRAAEAGRSAPSEVRGSDALQLPSLDPPPVRPLRLISAHKGVSVTIPRPPAPVEDEDGALSYSEKEWNAYVEECASYVLIKRMSVSNTLYELERVPRTGDAVVDAALAEVEQMPVDHYARVRISCYSRILEKQYHARYTYSIVGPPHLRVTLCTMRVPGFPFVLARGVGTSRTIAVRRAAMHAVAILRRIDPSYEDNRAAVETAVRVAISSFNVVATQGKADIEDFDLDAFNALPLINTDAVTSLSAKERRHLNRIRVLFASESAWYAKRRDFSVGGKKRAIAMYTLCYDVPPADLRERIRLIPRLEENAPTTTLRSRDATPLLQIGSSDAGDATSVRVNVGAIFSARVSVDDEDGNTLTGTCSGGGEKDNSDTAYERLFAKMEEQLPAMKPIVAMLKLHPYLLPTSIPSLQVPAALRDRMQHCLRNQQDLSDTGANAEAAAAPEAPSAVEAMQGVEDADKRRGWGPDGSELPSADETAERSALLLEQLQQRTTNPLYLERFAVRRAQLSIAAHKQEILDSVRNNPVTIICGTTGCGKTTQVPQYILDEATLNGKGGECKILLSQPRRISAVSIAQRIAAERLEQLEDSVGYVIRFEARRGRHINLATVGVVLRHLQMDPMLRNFNYLIIDEIHERDVNTDFLLMLLRPLLKRRPDLRVVLMSATLQGAVFQRYFDGAPLLQVEGHMFPVQDLYLEDLLPVAQQYNSMSPQLKELAGTLKSSSHKFRRRGAAASSADEGDLDTVHLVPSEKAGRAAAEGQKTSVVEVTSSVDVATVQFAVEHALRTVELNESAILVFLPGWDDIRRVREVLERNASYHILALHSSVTPEKQLECFLPAPPGKFKIVLSTNIAESGVTIDDVGVVIDTGRLKEMAYATRSRSVVPKTDSRGYDSYLVVDSSSVTSTSLAPNEAQGKYMQLMEIYASRANCVQRRGRCGRTRPGLCIRLFTREHFAHLHDYQTPQLHRIPLDNLCLTALKLGIGDPREFLQTAMEPPIPSEVEGAMRRLHELGATTERGQLTALGRRLAVLPMTPPVAKTVLIGAALRCLDTALSIAAMDSDSVFLRNFDERAASRVQREDLSCGTLSDTLACVNGYNYWAAVVSDYSPVEAGRCTRTRRMSPTALLRISLLKRQYFNVLVDSGFLGDVPRTTLPSSKRQPRPHEAAFNDRSEYSTHALDVGLAKALVTASALPSLALLSGPTVVRTPFDNYIPINNDSILRAAPCTPQMVPYVVYKSLLRITHLQTLMVTDATTVTIWSVLLMSTRGMKLDYDQELRLGSLNNWVFFRCSYAVVEQVRRFKALLDRRLERKFVDPFDAVNNARLDELSAVVRELLSLRMHPNSLHPDSVVWCESGTILSPDAPHATTAAVNSEADDAGEADAEDDGDGAAVADGASFAEE